MINRIAFYVLVGATVLAFVFLLRTILGMNKSESATPEGMKKAFEVRRWRWKVGLMLILPIVLELITFPILRLPAPVAMWETAIAGILMAIGIWMVFSGFSMPWREVYAYMQSRNEAIAPSDLMLITSASESEAMCTFEELEFRGLISRVRSSESQKPENEKYLPVSAIKRP